MPWFRDTKGLIVDVRGNSGGSRAALLALAGYLTDPERGPWVGNIAAYRLHRRHGADHLSERLMYSAEDARWTDAQRAAIELADVRFGQGE